MYMLMWLFFFLYSVHLKNEIFLKHRILNIFVYNLFFQIEIVENRFIIGCLLLHCEINLVIQNVLPLFSFMYIYISLYEM